MPINFDDASRAAVLSRPDLGQGWGAQARPTAQKPEGARFLGELVSAERTQLSGTEAARALSRAWQSQKGQAPSRDTLAVLVGQWAHETGRGASMLNYNFGGIKGTGPSGMSASYRTREGFGEQAVRTVDRFRAYGSAEEGATDYVQLLARRYPAAIEAAERGDAASFVRSLKAGGYFTDNEASYVKSVSSLAEQARAQGFDAIGARSAVPLPKAAAPRGINPAREAAPALAHATRVEQPSLAELGAFVDEVNRAALLSSALRIAGGEPRRG